MRGAEPCPRCGAATEQLQEYCLECGLRLRRPGLMPALAQGWRRRLPWYPGDWIWLSLAALLVAVVAGAAAIVWTRDAESAASRTLVVASLPTSANREAALTKARQALRAGLPQVGVLESSRFSSLHPGYFVVFSGVYSSLSTAQDAASRAAQAGYGNAYARRVTSA